MKVCLFSIIAICTFGASVSRSQTTWPVILELACGTYQTKGNLDVNSAGQFILTIRKDTTSPIELILLGGSASHKLRNIRREVALEFYVPKALNGNNRPFVFLQSFLRRDSIQINELRFIKRENCGLGKKYYQYN